MWMDVLRAKGLLSNGVCVCANGTIGVYIRKDVKLPRERACGLEAQNWRKSKAFHFQSELPYWVLTRRSIGIVCVGISQQD